MQLPPPPLLQLHWLLVRTTEVKKAIMVNQTK